jgi:hypothetical protein
MGPKTHAVSVLFLRAYIQRRDCIIIVAWSVILSFHGGDPIAEVKMMISPFLRGSLNEVNYWVLLG